VKKTDFIKNLCKLTPQEDDGGALGYYPFNVYFKSGLDGKDILMSIASVENSQAVYLGTSKTYRANECTEGFIALDFPCLLEDCPYDFIAIFSIAGGKISIEAMPYNTGGEFQPTIYSDSSNVLTQILTDINRCFNLTVA